MDLPSKSEKMDHKKSFTLLGNGFCLKSQPKKRTTKDSMRFWRIDFLPKSPRMVDNKYYTLLGHKIKRFPKYFQIFSIHILMIYPGPASRPMSRSRLCSIQLKGKSGAVRAGSLLCNMLEVHKELSNSYREGTARKLKSMAQPYKTKVLKKKKIEFYDDGIEIGDNPIGRGAERCEEKAVFDI